VNQLMGHQLAEMAELSAVRQQKVIVLGSIAGSIAFSIYGYHHLSGGDYLFGFLNLGSLIVTLANLIYLIKWQKPKYTDLIFTLVLLIQGIVILLYGNSLENRLLWLFPIMATTIFINTFSTGLVISIGFCLLSAIAILTDFVTISSDPMATRRFFISLVTLCGVCNTSSFFYSKAIRYIQSLYKEGIEKLAYSDQLTGLANRWSFENWATAKLAQIKKDNTITALVFLDIDNFKYINDNYGHDIGDKVLKTFTYRLKNNLRTQDRKTNKKDYSIARFAGDEFVLLLYDVKSLTDLDKILCRICHLFGSHYQGKEQLNNVTISMGAALYPQDADTLSELIRCADKAMYNAKHHGKNQYCYYQGANNPLLNSADLDGNVTPLKKSSGSMA